MCIQSASCVKSKKLWLPPVLQGGQVIYIYFYHAATYQFMAETWNSHPVLKMMGCYSRPVGFDLTDVSQIVLRLILLIPMNFIIISCCHLCSVSWSPVCFGVFLNDKCVLFCFFKFISISAPRRVEAAVSLSERWESSLYLNDAEFETVVIQFESDYNIHSPNSICCKKIAFWLL